MYNDEMQAKLKKYMDFICSKEYLNEWSVLLSGSTDVRSSEIVDADRNIWVFRNNTYITGAKLVTDNNEIIKISILKDEKSAYKINVAVVVSTGMSYEIEYEKTFDLTQKSFKKYKSVEQDHGTLINNIIEVFNTYENKYKY